MKKILVGLIVMFGVAILLATLVIFSGLGFFYKYLDQFSRGAQLSKTQVISNLLTYQQVGQKTQEPEKVWLMLGIDSLPGRGQQLPLTDSILLVRFNPQKNSITTLSLPRDIYLDSQKAKINSIYAGALNRQKTNAQINPQEEVKQKIAEFTGVSIDRVIIFTMEDVASLVDDLGGLSIDVQNPFIDPLFPRPEVDVTKVKDPKALYETVEFKAGTQIMDGNRILQYVRSRHATGIEGTDLARNARQQQVIAALVNKLTDISLFGSPEKLGNLYRFYLDRFAVSIPIDQLIALAISFGQNRQVPQIMRSSISVYPESPDGLLYHPPEYRYGGAWVFAVRDLKKFQNFIQQDLSL